MATGGSIRLGPFELDGTNQCLRRGALEIPIKPRAWEVLRFLANRRGRLVTKRELLDGVWGDAVVSESVIKVCVREIRKALDDDADEPRFIETFHRRGYRLRAEAGAPAAGVSDDRLPVPTEPTRTRLPLRVTAPPIMVGRERDLQWLRDRFAEARAGQRQVAILAGESGQGKTTLLHGFLVEVQDRQDIALLRGRCVELHGASEPYLPVIEAMSVFLADDPRQRARLRQLAPSWRADLRDLPPDASAEDERFIATRGSRMREMVDLLGDLAADRTLILVIEDLHWSDASTLDLLQLLAARPAGCRMLVMLTWRQDDAIGERRVVRDTLHALIDRRIAVERTLGPLAEADVADYLRRLGLAASDEVVAALLRVTAGNPLFLSEVVAECGPDLDAAALVALVDRPDATPIPAAISRIFERQVGRLANAERDALEAASVAGLDFAVEAVAAIVERDGEEVENTFEQLARSSGLVRPRGVSEFPDGTVTARFVFRHALLRSFLYERIGRARRARWHRLLADRGVEAFGDRLAEIAVELAEHRERAGQTDAAIAVWRLAGEAAVRRHAYPEAERVLDRALALVGTAPGGGSVRLDLLEARGRVRRASGDMRGAAAAFAELADRAREDGDVQREVVGWLLRTSAASWIDRDLALHAVRAARELLPGVTDEVLQAHVRGACGYWHLLLVGYRDEDRRACEAARAATERAGRADLCLSHTVRLSYFECLRSRYTEALALADQGAQLARSVGDGFEFLLARFFAAWSLLHAGRWGLLLDLIDDSEAIARKNGHDPWACLFVMQRGWLHEHLGELDEAQRLCGEALVRVREGGQRFGELIGRSLLSYVHLARGDAAAARAEIDGTLAFIDTQPVLMDWIWRIHLIHGRSEARLLHGDLDGAEADARETLRQAAEPDERVYLALAWRRLAQVALRRQDLNTARQHAAAAVAALHGFEIPFAAWRVHEIAAECARLAGDGAAQQHHAEQRAAALAILDRSLADHPAMRARFAAGLRQA